MCYTREGEFMAKKKNNTFIVMWDCTGVEAIVPVDMVKLGDGGDMLAKLEEKENTYGNEISRVIWAMKLRAAANGQRHYEIYTVITLILIKIFKNKI